MPEAEQIDITRATVLDTIHRLLRQRGVTEIVVGDDSRLNADLGMDSLELAELSAVLEDELGHEPFSAGIVPETVAELLAYYDTRS